MRPAQSSTSTALVDDVDFVQELPSEADVTPGKLLEQISPVPTLPARVKKATRNLGGEGPNISRKYCKELREGCEKKESGRKKTKQKKETNSESV